MDRFPPVNDSVMVGIEHILVLRAVVLRYHLLKVFVIFAFLYFFSDSLLPFDVCLFDLVIAGDRICVNFGLISHGYPLEVTQEFVGRLVNFVLVGPTPDINLNVVLPNQRKRIDLHVFHVQACLACFLLRSGSRISGLCDFIEIWL